MTTEAKPDTLYYEVKTKALKLKKIIDSMYKLIDSGMVKPHNIAITRKTIKKKEAELERLERDLSQRTNGLLSHCPFSVLGGKK